MAFTVRASHPISFHLLNRDGHPVIGIFDGHQGQMSLLDISNDSRRDLRPKTFTTHEPSALYHHFELKFRRGTLDTGTPPIAVEEGDAGWKISKPTDTEDGVSLFLLSTNPRVLGSGKSTSLALLNLGADGSGGARGTRVELRWGADSLEYVSPGGGAAEALVAGHRIEHLSIVNESGQKHIPLHVGIVGPNKILNDGKTPNKLKLRITNLLTDGTIHLNPTPRTEYPPSEFTITFDSSKVDKREEWALGTTSEVAAIGITANAYVKKPNGDIDTIEFNVDPKQQGQSKVWILSPKKPVPLGPDDYIEAILDNIVSSLPSGLTNVYVHYKNIPGYWDGDFVSLIEKAPLVYFEQTIGTGTAAKNVQYVGIGVTQPQAKLQIAGDVRVDGATSEIFFQDNGQIRSFNNSQLIRFDRAGKLMELRTPGSISFSPGATSQAETKKVVFTDDGKVGIGNAKPGKTLTVNGGLRVEQEVSIGGEGVFDVDKPGTNGGRLRITKEGNVGIGTPNPQAKLQVKGGDFRLDDGTEILFDDNGQIRSKSDAHRILFRRSENKLELREGGDIIFSPGSDGSENVKVTIKADGKVGIGTQTPRTSLEIMGGLRVENEVSVGGENTFVIDAHGVPGGRLTILKNGNVGIGTTNPGYPLEVGKSVSDPIRGQFWYCYSSHSSHAPNGSAQDTNTSIRAAGAITTGTTLYVTSDARIKKDFRPTEPAADLAILSRLPVTDFKYLDFATCGDRYKKGFIAQQVDEIFPQAVSRQIGVIPDIYRLAQHADGWVELATDLKKGERVRLISEHCEGVYEVLDSTPDKFLTDFNPESNQVFVFGREVRDLHVIDHDAICVLNVSATQQLKKELDHEIKALRAENAELRAANDALERRLQLIESKLEASLGVVTAGNGSNGNGRH